MTDDCVGEAGSSCRARTSYGAEARPTDRLVPSSLERTGGIRVPEKASNDDTQSVQAPDADRPVGCLDEFVLMPNRSEAPKPVRRPAEFDEVASSSPLGAIALFLLAKWKQAGDRGLLFISEDDGRAEQLGAILHALDPDCGVMVLPQLDTLPYDGMEPSLSIMCRRASVLRRMAERPSSPLLVMTPEAALPSVPSPDFWTVRCCGSVPETFWTGVSWKHF